METHHRHGPGTRTRRALVACWLAGVSGFIASPGRFSLAAEIKGEVREVSGNTVKVVAESPGAAKLGDRVEIFEILPDIQEEAGVATGRVVQASGGTVRVTLDPNSGAVAPGQRARILAETPGGGAADPFPTADAADSPALAPHADPTQILRDDFDEPSPRAVPLLGAESMSFTTSDGQGFLSGTAPGVLSAMYPERAGDFVAEFELRVPTVTDDSGYGLVLRGAPVRNGRMTDYYLVLIKPNKQVISLACWHNEKWSWVKEYSWKDAVYLPAQANRVRLEVVGAHFRTFLNDTLVCELDDDTLKGPGALGLCIAAASSRPGAVMFDNLSVVNAVAGALPQPVPPAEAPPAARGSWAGLTIGPAPNYGTGVQGPSRVPGVRVVGAWPDGPAQNAGLRRGDIILKVGGTATATEDAFNRCLANLRRGEEVVCVFLRGNQRRRAKLTLASRVSDAQLDERLRTLAEEGEVWAQVELGDRHVAGVGFEKSESQAVAWYRKAAEQGDSEGEWCLAEAYLEGKGVPQDNAAAFRWFKRSADQGYAPAQVDLANLYAEGLGVAQDHAKAISWWLKAADQGHGGAINSLGWAYEHGKGVARNPAKAVTCYQLAAEKGNVNAKLNLGDMYANADGVTANPQQALRLYREAADEDDGRGLLGLGFLHEYGKGVTQDYAKAMQYYHEAAKKGLSVGQYRVGCLCVDGKGVRRDYATALAWFRLAADQKNADAQFSLGEMYLNGWGVERDDREAVQWFHKAALQGLGTAQHNLGTLCLLGQGVQRDYQAALGWFRLAAKQGIPDSERSLGAMYLNGWGVPVDKVEAIALFLKASDQGDKRAKEILKSLGIKP